MHGRLDFHKSNALNALLTSEAHEQAKSAQDHRFDDWLRYAITVCICCFATFIFIAQII